MKNNIFSSKRIVLLLNFFLLPLHAIIPDGWALPSLRLSDYMPNNGMQRWSLSTTIDDFGNGMATWITTTSENTRVVAVARFENNQWQPIIHTFRETHDIEEATVLLHMTPSGNAFIIWHEGPGLGVY